MVNEQLVKVKARVALRLGTLGPNGRGDDGAHAGIRIDEDDQREPRNPLVLQQLGSLIPPNPLPLRSPFAVQGVRHKDRKTLVLNREAHQKTGESRPRRLQ